MPVSDEIQQKILSAYREGSSIYADFSRKIGGLVQDLLFSQKIALHSVAFRSKKFESLAGKIARPDKNYAELADVTDLAGIRITTYFADDVDRVAAVLQDEFEIDRDSSVDKRLYADPDRFGYQSLHRVISLDKKRADLSEYARFAGFKCEVQVRSILQHAWAEIEHDLGYKTVSEVPFQLRRRFARIAGLFELADDEFLAIRDELRKYEQSLPEKIRETPSAVDLDLSSLRALYSVPSTLTALDDAVVRGTGAKLVHMKQNRLDTFLERLHGLGINTVQKLEQAAIAEVKDVERFSKYWVNSDLGTVLPGIGIFYLVYVLYSKTRDRKKIRSYLDKYEIGSDAVKREKLADKILEFK